LGEFGVKRHFGPLGWDRENWTEKAVPFYLREGALAGPIKRARGAQGQKKLSYQKEEEKRVSTAIATRRIGNDNGGYQTVWERERLRVRKVLLIRQAGGEKKGAALP